MMFKSTTGNAELDSVMNGLNMMGVDPELADLMRQAEEQQESDMGTSAAKAKQYAYYTGGGTAPPTQKTHSCRTASVTACGTDRHRDALGRRERKVFRAHRRRRS